MLFKGGGIPRPVVLHGIFHCCLNVSECLVSYRHTRHKEATLVVHLYFPYLNAGSVCSSPQQSIAHMPKSTTTKTRQATRSHFPQKPRPDVHDMQTDASGLLDGRGRRRAQIVKTLLPRRDVVGGRLKLLPVYGRAFMKQEDVWCQPGVDSWTMACLSSVCPVCFSPVCRPSVIRARRLSVLCVSPRLSSVCVSSCVSSVCSLSVLCVCPPLVFT